MYCLRRGCATAPIFVREPGTPINGTFTPLLGNRIGTGLEEERKRKG